MPDPAPPTPTSAPLDPQALKDYIDGLEQLHDLLDDAYWAATTIDAKDAFNGLSQAIFDILTTLEAGEIESATPQYVALKADVDAVNTKLDSVQVQVNGWIHKIALANQVVGAMAQGIALAAKVFTL
ncbi:MAG TPA: hypothetical protein VH595_23590 [Verrucomicrobiae bacterium]|jgi:hypothetical protein|nr:hypothetical protein [Verrucomicrobiae bacterium]